MEESRNDIEGLIIRWLSGDVTEEEAKNLESRIENDPSIRRLVDSYKKTWDLVDPEMDEVMELNVDEEWEILSDKLFVKKLSPQLEKESESEYVNIEPVKKGNWLRYSRIAAVFFLIAVIAFSVISYLYNPDVRYLTQDSIEIFELPDGSVISLNQHSLVKFKEDFKGKKREVYLEGEAYFEVESDPSKPFVVSTKNAKVEVLGTKFNVRAYFDDDEIDISVTEGKVAFSSVSGESITLTKNESSSYSKKEEEFTEIKPNPVNSISWKTRILDFDNTTLDEVIKVLENSYPYEFVFSNTQLKECSITVQFENQEIESILTVIEATLNVSFDINEKTVTISGDGC